ncbi:MAG: hypothetical protein QXH08_00390 [Candidatus Hadarchaeales archaeon]
MSTPIPPPEPAKPTEQPIPPKPQPSKPKLITHAIIIGVGVLIVAIIVATSFFPITPPVIERKCTLSGYVLAGPTAEYRVVNATVEVKVGGRSYTAVTDSWGAYSLQLPTGNWQVRIKVGDNIRYTENISVPGSQREMKKDIYNVIPELASGDGGSIGDVRVVYVPATSRLTGYVFAGSERSYRLSGAMVEIEVRGQTYATTTGGSGEYTVEAPVGTWPARVKIGGHVQSSDTINVSIGQNYLIKEWYNIAPELIPDKSADGVRCVYVESGWRETQRIKLG